MTLRRQAPKLSAAQYAENFADYVPAMQEPEALAESSRCLYCYDAPCTGACPTHIDVPGFIKKIHSGNLRGSARVIYEANLFGGSCARVCPVEVLCEGACVYNGMHQEPIQIARLQRYATDFAMRRRVDLLPKLARNGRRVVAVGAGPAGLTFAGEAARYGYEATVLEARPLAGGLNTYAMADYKLSAPFAIDEAKRILDLGVEIQSGVTVGSDAGDTVSVDSLLRDYDAVFLGVGLGSTNRLRIPGEELPGCIDALAFIEDIKLKERHDVWVGRRVAVIGAGNTAIDAVTQARRLGAERVMLVYRRSEHEMSAYHYEFEIAKSDQVEFVWLAAPVRIEGDGHVERLVCERMRARAEDEFGKTQVEPTGEHFTLEVDHVIKAIGQEKRRAWLRSIAGLTLDAAGRIAVDDEGRTGVANLWAGGDCINGGKEAVNAVAHGKRSARAMYAGHFGREPAIR